MFKTDAALIALFKDFKELPDDIDDLRENEALEHHASLVMGIIDDAIMHIDNVDHVIATTGRTGATHTQFVGFTCDLFWVCFL